MKFKKRIKRLKKYIKKNKVIITITIISIIIILLICLLVKIVSVNKSVGKILECTIDQTTEDLKASTTMTVAYLDNEFHDFRVVTKIDISDKLKSKDKIIETLKKNYVSTDDVIVEIISTDNEIQIIKTSTNGHSMEQTYEELKKELENSGYKCK